MNKILLALATVLTLGSCANQPAKVVEEVKPENKCIRPLSSGTKLNEVKDGTISASFTCDDFNWMGGNLKMTVYVENVYDSVKVRHMIPGDTIVCDIDTIIVDTVVIDGGYVTINGGYENEGLDLQSTNKGTYRATIEDDHSVYTELGDIEFPLDDNFTIVDCDAEDPGKPSELIKKNQKKYIEKLQEDRRNFNSLNTEVNIKDGKIVNITRKWIP